MSVFDNKALLYGLIGFYVLIGVGIYFFVDIPVAQFFKQFDGTDFKGVMTFLSQAGESHWFIIGGLAVYLLYKKSNPLLAKYGVFIVSSVAVSGMISGIFKVIFGRMRPVKYLNEDLYGFEGWHFNEYKFNSFPSGHTTTGFAVGIALALMFPRYAYYFIFFGFFVGLTRVATTVHYLSDTMAGALLGTLVSIYIYRHFIKEPYAHY